MGWTKHAGKKRAILLNALDEKAYVRELMYDLVSPSKPEETSYQDLVSEFNKHFDSQQTVFAARYKFYAAHKQPDESVKQWQCCKYAYEISSFLVGNREKY